MTAGRVVVTGAAGFIGRAACTALTANGHRVEGWVREGAGGIGTAPLRGMGDLAEASVDSLARALEDVAAIVHLAGRAHAQVTAEALQRDNVEATARLAHAARRAGVKRFVHVSSVKVNGERTKPGHPFRPDDAPAPADAYARSKLDAERASQEALGGSATARVVLRLPLVYGPGAPGNFAALAAAVRARRVLPLGAIRNLRHLLGIANLAAALHAVLDAPLAPAGVHFVADADSVSTPQLVRAIGAALGVTPRLVALPVPLLALGGQLLGRGAAIERLTRSLEVDTGTLVAATSWRPLPFRIDAATLAG